LLKIESQVFSATVSERKPCLGSQQMR